MSHLRRRGKTHSMRHKKNKKSRNHKRSLKNTRKMRRSNKMSSRRRRNRHMKSKRNNRKRYSLHQQKQFYNNYGMMGKTFRGGSGIRSLLPMELVNLGDNIRSGISSVAHDVVGSVYNPPSAMPHQDHPINRNTEFILPKIADVGQIFNEQSAKVANLYN
jgi:hypothetical protein